MHESGRRGAMTEPPADDEEASAPTPRMLAWVRNSAAYRLSRKMMTERELADAIARKAKQKFEGISETQLVRLKSAAVEFGRTMLALDDASYAGIRAKSSARAGKSKRAIARKLMDRGVDRQIIDQALAEADDLQAALIFARKRAFGPFRRVERDEKRQARELSAFTRNGFSFEIGRKVMEMDRDEAEERILP